MEAPKKSLSVVDRKTGQAFAEKVLGGSWINWAYGTGLGKRGVSSKTFQRLLSKAVGHHMKTAASKKRIPEFIKTYDIQMKDFEVPQHGFRSFNDFFVRKLAANARNFAVPANYLSAPAEGRLSVFPIAHLKMQVAVKGQLISLKALLGETFGNPEYFENGHIYVFRLCPVDYHRFHFPDDGKAAAPTMHGHELHSVNPAALKAFPDVFLRNERQVLDFESLNFGRLAIIEIGALCVGTIRQSYLEKAGSIPGPIHIKRGQEKGYFEFGGSTLVMLTGPQIKVSSDLLANTQQNLETLVQVGEVVGEI